MEYLKFLLLSLLNLVISGVASFGIFNWLTKDMTNSTGSLGTGIFSMIVSVVAFLVLLGVVGFILYVLMF